MADASSPSGKAPWHLWLVGVVSLLWNVMGALDFTMTQLRNEAYLKAFTDEQRTYFFNLPLWCVVTWGIATWGGLVAAGFLLGRRALAVQLYLLSTVCMVVTTVYNYGLADGLKVLGNGATSALVFSAVIFVVCVLEVIYSRAMRKRGVLR
jgi:hypothetical protein